MPTISQLPAAASVGSADLLVTVQAGVTSKVTGSLVLSFVQSGITIAESQVTGLTADLAARLVAANNLSDVVSAATSRTNLGLGSAAVVSVPISLANGGTNANLTAANGAIPYSTGSAIALLAAGSSGQLFQSGGAGTPNWTTPTYPGTSGSASKILISDGTNNIYSTSLWVNTVGSAGVILRSNGTSNIYSTSTFADTYLINNLLYASSANTVAGLATGNNGVLITSAGGIPSISSTLPSAVQTNITALGSQSQALNMNSHLINNVTDPASAQDAATKNYVDTVAAGLNPIPGVAAASTVALTVLYSNGVAGVGATLTNNGAQVTFALDGQSPAVGARVLIKDQASTLQNGIYTVTNVGSGATNWILTRATDYDQPSEIQVGDFVIVENGTVNASKAYYQSAAVTTVGVDAITFVLFSSGGTVTSVASGTGLTGGPITTSGTLSLSYPVSSGGNVTKSLVYLYNSAAQTNVTGDGTVVTLNFDTVGVDRNTDYNTGTNLFTAPQTGMYLVTLFLNTNGWAADNSAYQVNFVSSSGGNSQTPLLANTVASVGTVLNGASPTWVVTSAVLLGSGHTFKITFSASGHATKNVSISAGAPTTAMSIFLIA